MCSGAKEKSEIIRLTTVRLEGSFQRRLRSLCSMMGGVKRFPDDATPWLTVCFEEILTRLSLGVRNIVDERRAEDEI